MAQYGCVQIEGFPFSRSIVSCVALMVPRHPLNKYLCFCNISIINFIGSLSSIRVSFTSAYQLCGGVIFSLEATSKSVVPP